MFQNPHFHHAASRQRRQLVERHHAFTRITQLEATLLIHTNGPLVSRAVPSAVFEYGVILRKAAVVDAVLASPATLREIAL
jgi:hypothetical protein